MILRKPVHCIKNNSNETQKVLIKEIFFVSLVTLMNFAGSFNCCFWNV